MRMLTISLMGLIAATLPACSGAEKSANELENGASNASAGNISNGSSANSATPRRLTPQEQFPTRELARQGYDERIECAAQAEAAKLLVARQVQAASMGATRDRLVLDEMSARGRAGAARAVSSVPGSVIGVTMDETSEGIEQRAAAIVRDRGSTPMQTYVDRVRDTADACYERFSS